MKYKMLMFNLTTKKYYWSCCSNNPLDKWQVAYGRFCQGRIYTIYSGGTEEQLKKPYQVMWTGIIETVK